MKRGIEVDIHLRPGLDDEEFVASALGNLATRQLAAKRRERLEWQVLRVDGSGHHHYRLVVRPAQRLLDLGARSDLARIPDDLSNEGASELHHRFSAAKTVGLHPMALRRVRGELDPWRDDFWNWIG